MTAFGRKVAGRFDQSIAVRAAKYLVTEPYSEVVRNSRFRITHGAGVCAAQANKGRAMRLIKQTNSRILSLEQGSAQTKSVIQGTVRKRI